MAKTKAPVKEKARKPVVSRRGAKVERSTHRETERSVHAGAPKDPATCSKQSHRQGPCSKTITPDLDTLADDKCRVEVPIKRDSFLRGGKRIYKYRRMCTPSEISRFVLRDDVLRSDFEAQLDQAIREALRTQADVYTDPEESLAFAFNDFLGQTHGRYGAWADLIPPFYRWHFWQKIVVPYIRNIEKNFEPDPESEIADPYYYLPPDMADALIIWTGSRSDVMPLIFNPQGVDLVDWMDRGNFGTDDRLAIENFTANVSGKPSKSADSLALQKRHGVKAGTFSDARELYRAMTGQGAADPYMDDDLKAIFNPVHPCQCDARIVRMNPVSGGRRGR